LSKKVLFVMGTEWASGYYRMSQAADLLAKSGFKTETTMFHSIDPISLTALKQIPLGKDAIIKLLDFDVIIFQLIWDSPLLYAISIVKSRGIKTVMEIDDDYFSLPADNPSWISFHPKIITKKFPDGFIRGIKYNFKVNSKIDILKQAMDLVDIIQVSTPELAKVYGNYGETIVLQNCIDNELYDSVPKRKNKKPVIGWFGTRTHKADLELTLGWYPPQEDFTLLLAGWLEVKDLVFKDFNNVELIPPYRIYELPSIVKKCDFGIVPLVNCRFNDGKSELKGIEFGAASLPVIASDVAPYRRWIRHGENGLLVKKNKTKFWIRYMKELLYDKELRESMGKEAKRDAVKRDVRNHLEKWINAYFV